MRLRLILMLAISSLFLTSPGCNSQLTFSQGGLKMPPINLLTIYRILKKTWKTYMYPKSKKTSSKQGRGSSDMKNGTIIINDDGLEEGDNTRLLPDHLQIKLTLMCDKEMSNCSNKTLSEFLQDTNITLTESEANNILENKASTSFDIPLTEFLPPEKLKAKASPKEKEIIASKSPSFLPFPFASSGWLASYIALNGVFLGLYILLAGPYFLSGQNVNSFTPIDNREDEPSGHFQMHGYQNMHENEMDDNSGEYLGYTTYGDSDMFMSYMMADDDDDDDDDNDDEDNGNDTDDDKTKGEYTKEEEMDPNNGESDDGQDDDSQDDDTRCMQNMLCLRPAYGGRGLISSSFFLTLLDWIPGGEFFGKKFKKNMGRFEEAVMEGRQNRCHKYFCSGKRRHGK